MSRLYTMVNSGALVITAKASDSFYRNGLHYRVVNEDGTKGPIKAVYENDDLIADGEEFNLGDYAAGTQIEFLVHQDGSNWLTADDQAQVTQDINGSATFAFEDLKADPADNPYGFVADNDFNDVVFDVSIDADEGDASIQPAPGQGPSDADTSNAADDDPDIEAVADPDADDDIDAESATDEEVEPEPDEDDDIDAESATGEEVDSDPDEDGDIESEAETDEEICDHVFQAVAETNGTSLPIDSPISADRILAGDGTGLTLELFAQQENCDGDVRLEGEIIVQRNVPEPSSLLLMLDSSASMADALPFANLFGDRNGDNLSGSRIDALVDTASAIIDRYRLEHQSEEIKVDVVDFDGAARVAFQGDLHDADLDSAIQNLDVTQINGTNYDTALALATSLASNATTDIDAYFISDGAPFSANFPEIAAGLNRDTPTEVTVQAIGIGDSGPSESLTVIDSDQRVPYIQTPDDIEAIFPPKEDLGPDLLSIELLLDDSPVLLIPEDEFVSDEGSITFDHALSGLDFAQNESHTIEARLTYFDPLTSSLQELSTTLALSAEAVPPENV